MRDYGDLHRTLEYVFNDESILVNALTHSSYTSEEGKSYRYNNERLEFIGDGYLDAIIGVKLYEILPDVREGELSKKRAKIVCARTLATVARQIDLGAYLLLGNGEELHGGRDKDSILANALEAIIGAIVIDGGHESAKAVVLKLFGEQIRLAITNKLPGDYKTALQEKLQKKYKSVVIEYHVLSERGPDHDKEFEVEVSAIGEVLGRGIGKSKKDAEQNAAKDVLAKGVI